MFSRGNIQHWPEEQSIHTLQMGVGAVQGEGSMELCGSPAAPHCRAGHDLRCHSELCGSCSGSCSGTHAVLQLILLLHADGLAVGEVAGQERLARGELHTREAAKRAGHGVKKEPNPGFSRPQHTFFLPSHLLATNPPSYRF